MLENSKDSFEFFASDMRVNTGKLQKGLAKKERLFVKPIY
jgi:hypothetical protein